MQMNMFPTIRPPRVAPPPIPGRPPLIRLHIIENRLDRLEDRLGRLMHRDRERMRDILNVSASRIAEARVNDDVRNLIQEYTGGGYQRRRKSRRSKQSRKRKR